MADPTMTAPTLSNLLDRIKQAGGGDRELDAVVASIWERVTWSAEIRPQPCGADGNCLPAYTSDLNAALALVQARLPGWDWVVAGYDSQCWACLKPPGQDDGPNTKEYPGEHPASPALALLASLLTALIAEGVG